MTMLVLAAFASLGSTAPLHAQSATNDSELFSADERILEFGTQARNVTVAPFVQFDAGRYDFDPGPSGTDSVVNLGRLYLYGSYDRFGGTLAFDLQNDDFPIRYAFGSYSPDSPYTFKVGQQDEPFSLQDYSGSRFLPFLTSGQSAALIPGDNVGALVSYGGENFSLTGGVFGGDLNSGVGDEGVAITARATWAPVYAQSEITRQGDATREGRGTQRVENLLHLGAAVSARFDMEQPFSFGGSANTTIAPAGLASGPTIRDADLLRVNLEAARSIGSLSLQGELTVASVNGRQVDGIAHGGYVYATYFLTGERRGYDRASGTFGRVIPKTPIDEGGFGAIELGSRLSYLDLTDLGSNAGAQIGASAVVNAYLTKRITLTGEYSHTRGTAGAVNGTRADTLSARLQFAY